MDTATSELPLLQNFPVHGPRLLRSVPPLASVGSSMSPDALSGFAALCRSSDADLFAGLHAMFALLLARCSGERNLTVATPAPGMPVRLRTALADAPNFRELLRRSSECILDARADASLGEHATLLFELNLARRASRDVDPATGVTGDLALSAAITGDGLALGWIYASDLLSASTMARIVRRFDVLIDAVVADPERDLWRLALLDGDERRLVVEEWNATAAPYREGTLHGLFAEQARRTPDAIALAHRDVRLTYRELNERANRLAHHLRARGIRAQSPVPICMQRSPELVVGLLAIMKAGGAYVPIDPQYPRERIDFMVADSEAPWVLAQSNTLAQLNVHTGKIVVDDPELQAALCAGPAEDPEPMQGHGADALAYIIYTSGSTGRPKGVCIEHRQAAAMIGWALDVYDADALSGVLAATSICFDLSVFELFVPLCGGGRVVLVDHPLDFEGIASASGVRLVNTVPSAIKALLDEKAIPDSVRIVNLAGEPLPESLVKDIYAKTSAEAVYNLYGPSEDTTYSTYALVPRDEERAPSIGRAISNGQVYVLDAHLEPAAVGVVGEVYVAGAGVARGYWKRPDLTAERFIADPFRGVPGARMYRTGDLARWTERGDLDFLGRADYQVKLRGLRIELGEIQARLIDMEALDAAVVTVNEDARGEKQLVAYVVPVDQGVPEAELSRACRSFLAERLPDYMIPAVFVPMRELPLTPNGKIDRAALPPPPERPAPDYVAPTTESQARLAQLWQDVLRLPTAVSMHANFFDLGGNSLLAMRLLGRVRQEFEVVVPPKSLLSGASFEDFCRIVAQGGERAPPPLTRVADRSAPPLSFGQQGLWLTGMLEDNGAQFNVQQRYLLDGALDVDALRRAIDALVQRHESLRTVIVSNGDTVLQRVIDAPLVPFVETDLSAMSVAARSTEIERIVRDDALEVFALDRDSMLRVQLIRLDAARHELLLTKHHIATDGWSIDVMVADLGALYAAEMRSGGPALPQLPLQYIDFAAWQRDWLQEDVLDEHVRYWEDQLADLPTVHRLMLDRPRQPVPDQTAGTLRTNVHPAAARALQELCREERATVFMGLHALFSILLARWSGDEDIVIATPVANREQPELATLIGLFTNTVVLRSHVPGEATFLDLLRQSRNTVLEAYARQHVPFNAVVERLQPARSLSYTPLFQIMLSLQDTGRAPLQLPGLTVTTLRPRIELALVELMLEVSETAEGLVLDWIYRRELFDAATIERMARHFDNLLRAAVAQPRLDANRLPMLDDADRRQLASCDSQSAEAAAGWVHDLFELQARRDPGSLAVLSGAMRVDYGELDRRANRCAHLLRARGIGSQQTVGVFGERSTETIVALLATLKAGGVCLPLDARRSGERIAREIDTAGAGIVLTTQRHAAALSGLGVDVVSTDDPDVFAAYPESPVQRVAADGAMQDIAWMVQASDDSSGPARIALTHAALLNLCRWHAAEFSLDATGRCTLLADIDSDVGAWELCSTLLAGACAVPVDDAMRATPTALANLIRLARITHCIVADAIDDADTFGSDDLRVLLCRIDPSAGGSLPEAPAARRVRCYGRPEAAAVSVWCDVDGAVGESGPMQGLSLGRPSARARVLNDAFEPQPVGAIGELCIGVQEGACAPFDAEAQTAGKYVRDPLAVDPDARLYRTGDLACWRADGTLEWIGRKSEYFAARRAHVAAPDDGTLEPAARATATAPATASETALHALWAKLLLRDAIDIDMNFFAAGGNSLLLMRMLHGIRERLGAHVHIKEVYDHPTIRRLAAALDARAESATEIPTPKPPQRGRSALSLSQFRIWYLEQLRDSNEHNVPLAVSLNGAVDVALLERALNRLVERHDMLRTGFALENEAPVQIIETDVALPLEFHDLSAMEPAEAEAGAWRLAVDFVGRRFDIRRPPLLAALLVRTANDEYTLQLNFHHLVFDGWSFAIFLDELIAIYDAFADGVEPEMPASEHGYADFVAWQQDWLDSGSARSQAMFWRDYLSGCPEHLTLARPGGWSDDGDAPSRLDATVGAATRTRLLQIASDRQGTLFSVLYSAFALLLGRLAGQHDLSIGIPVSGRHLFAAQDVIGNFLNNLPVRTSWEPQQSFAEFFAGQVRNLGQVLSHQDYPFEKLLELAPHLRGSETTPIFQVFFNMPSMPRSVEPRRFDVALRESPEIEPKFDLTMYLEDDGTGIALTCHYKRQQLAPGFCAHLLRQYVYLLDQIAVDPQRACGAYSLRPEVPEEGPRSLEPQRYWLGAVHEIFRRRALDCPLAVAISEHGQQWTYAEVLHASTVLAHSLQQQNIGRGEVVAIVAARRATLVVAMLAVLQTGAAFSLLNPEYPVDRVALLVDIIEPACVLFAGEAPLFPSMLNERLTGRVACRHLPAAKGALLAGTADGFVPLAVVPEQLACVTFTSGTTGVPKAVAGTHIGIAGYLGWVPQWLELSQDDRFSLLSGLGHDPLQRDVFGPLCIGATLVIPEPDAIAPHLLAQWLLANAITFVHLTPAMAEILCTTDATGFPSLRVAFLTGDRLNDGTVEKLIGLNGAIRVLNSYGTTETQRATTYFEASAARTRRGMVPVSEAAPDTVIRVLNAMGAPCGLSEVGDLFVESHALSLGYINDPELTAQVFTGLPDGRRRYRTGDIGCRLPDGTIMLLGRKDNQVKIRGFRIESGEIEAHARGHRGVAEAAVLPLERRPGDTVLVVYIVPAASDADERQLRIDVLEHLRANLPPYMVPAAAIVLERMPLTPNGKLDRRALPLPTWDEPACSVAPRNDLERTVASIWAEVLGVEHVGAEDNFFALGGHSMLMVLLLVQIQERFGLGVDIGRILSCTTVAEQARVLESIDG